MISASVEKLRLFLCFAGVDSRESDVLHEETVG